ncbi:hypothetical protein PIB30_078736 [Stylosanthes scabra]|uniref:Uncharacterized protein n=1 Tax=Stylosanthes scabra TaxID=79078 RepID=A0ABU6QQH7_9FABA|nr:hypothetical protein [Stylosanthes scabra]
MERKAAAKSTEKQIKAPAKTALKNKREPLLRTLLKQIYDRYDVHDNTIYSDAAAVKITTYKIGHALGLSSRGTPYDTKVARNELSEEDKAVHDYFKGFTTVALQDLIKATPVNTEENKKLWMRAFILFVQKVFLLPNSTAKICAAALPTLFDLENTRQMNWAHHVHNFLLQELKKAKRKESAAIHGCCYVLMIIYFYETQFGENSTDPASTTTMGLLKTGQLRAEKEQLKKKNTKRVPSSDSESQAEPEPPYSNSDETISEQPPQQKEIRSKRRFDHAVVGSNATLNPTQESSAFAGLPDPDNVSLADALINLRKRKKEAMEIRKPKKRSGKGNEADETIHEVLRSASKAVAGSSDRTRMFDSFDTVSLGRDNITETQPSQPSNPGNDRGPAWRSETEVTTHHAEEEVRHAEAEILHAEVAIHQADKEVYHAEVVLPTEIAINTETVAEKENQDESTILEMPKQQPPPVNASVMQDIVEEHEPLTVIM